MPISLFFDKEIGERKLTREFPCPLFAVRCTDVRRKYSKILDFTPSWQICRHDDCLHFQFHGFLYPLPREVLGKFEKALPLPYIYNNVENDLARVANIMQRRTPTAVGSSAATSVHLMLPVSFLTVIRVVEQGQ